MTEIGKVYLLNKHDGGGLFEVMPMEKIEPGLYLCIHVSRNETMRVTRVFEFDLQFEQHEINSRIFKKRLAQCIWRQSTTIEEWYNEARSRFVQSREDKSSRVT